MENLKMILKNKKAIAISVVVVIIIVVVVVRKRKNKGKGQEGNTASKSGGGNSNFPTATFPLTPYSQAGEYSTEKGSYGQQIANLQMICNTKFGKNLTVDGKFGPASENAFRECFGFPYAMPYSEILYEMLLCRYGNVLKNV